ncbi:MAG: sugar transferase [Clostridiales Family XIII bacterium]|jgi:lipopolysaccharide/colanic/teichoic acid biosynthesis glycosyltransferase|nr:sugar transferase [Clostridiales Family XIII bacterium]
MLYGKCLKRLCDILFSLAALALLSPLFLVLWLRVRRELGAPAVFRQERPGRGGRLFTMHKFRSMTDASDAEGRPLPDGERLSPFGESLRRSSLDELPELWDVLRGKMSLIGPRPLLVAYLPLYSAEQRRRHDVRPGLTGWAQVNGRNALSWEKKFELDLWYVDHLSAALDMRILFMTAAAVLRREGISQEGSATTEPFRGNGKDEG